MEITSASNSAEVMLPEYSLKYVGYSERRLGKHNDEYHMCPCILAKLILVISFLQWKNKPYKTWNHRGNEHTIQNHTGMKDFFYILQPNKLLKDYNNMISDSKIKLLNRTYRYLAWIYIKNYLCPLLPWLTIIEIG